MATALINPKFKTFQARDVFATLRPYLDGLGIEEACNTNLYQLESMTFPNCIHKPNLI